MWVRVYTHTHTHTHARTHTHTVLEKVIKHLLYAALNSNVKALQPGIIIIFLFLIYDVQEAVLHLKGLSQGPSEKRIPSQAKYRASRSLAYWLVKESIVFFLLHRLLELIYE